MDSDSDQSLDDFKNPERFSAKEKFITLNEMAKKQQVTKKHSKIGGSKKSIRNGTKLTANTRRKVSIHNSHPTLKLTAPNESLESSDLIPCPTCGKMFVLSEIIQHNTACLRANFGACKFVKQNVASTDDASPAKLKTAEDHRLAVSLEPYFCISCAGDLSTLSAEQRNVHINRCVDHFSKVPTVRQDGKKVTETAGISLQAKKQVSQTVNCPFCLKALTSRGLKRHLVACQRKHKFSTMTALALHRPEDGEVVDDELLAEIQRSETRPQDVANYGENSTNTEKGSRKPRRRKSVESYNNEMMQLAIAVSNNENLEKRKPKKLKKQQKVIIPVMITLSPNSKRQQLQGRLHSIAHPEGSDVDIPRTPVLPATSFRLSNVRVISNPQSRQFSDDGDERPGTSAIRTSGGHGNEASSSQVSPEQVESGPSATTAFAGLRNSPVDDCEDELQSPEVSSSNIKNTTVYQESSVDPGTSGTGMFNPDRQEHEVQCNVFHQDTVSWRSAAKNRWTVTKSARLEKGVFRVSGLLSQFDEEKRENLVSSPDCNDIDNSTLLALETLDKSAENDSTVQDVMNSVSDHQEPQEQNPLSSQPFASFVKLIDNPQFSDASILAGDSKEIIYMHKNILFCCCPLLLREINKYGNNILYLHGYRKSEILPLINYIYSRRIEPLLNAAHSSEVQFSKTVELMNKFGVNVPDCHRDILHTVLGQIQPENKLSVTKAPDTEQLAGNCTGSRQEHGSEDECHIDAMGLQNFTDNNAGSHEVQRRHECLKAGEMLSDSDMFDFGDISDRQKEKDLFENASSSANQSKFGIVDKFDTGQNKIKEGHLSKKFDMEPELPVHQHHQNEKISAVAEQAKEIDKEKDREHRSSKPVKRKRPSDTPLGLRKSRRRLSSFRRRHSDWKTRQCSCCTDTEAPIYIEDRIPKLHERANIHERLKHTDRRLSKGHLYQKGRSPRRKIPQNISRIKHTLSSPTKNSQKNKKRHPVSKRTPQKQKPKLEKRRILRSSQPTKNSIVTFKTVDKHMYTPESQKSKGCSTRWTRNRHTEENSLAKSQTQDQPTSNTKSNLEDVAIELPGFHNVQSPSNKVPVDFPKSQELKGIDRENDKRDMAVSTLEIQNMSKSHIEVPLHRYVTERLPRFKQREHIRNRPGVANMGKTTNRASKISKKTPSVPTKIELWGDKILGASSLNKATELNFPLEEQKSERVSDLCKYPSVFLPGYAVPSPLKSSFDKSGPTNIDAPLAPNDSDKESHLSAIFFDDSFENKVLETPGPVENLELFSPHQAENFSTPVSEMCKSRYGFRCIETQFSSPIVITPMPNFKGMPTPELLQRAKNVGMKQRLGKGKIRTKLEEVYLYQHQILSDASHAESNVSHAMKKENSHEESSCYESPEEDDLRIGKTEISKSTLKLSGMCAVSTLNRSTKNIYAFSELPKDKVLDLSSQVVDSMHLDGSLLKALQEMEAKTGSIKRGSQQDRKRCWAMVTPGSSEYNVKLDAILRLPEDYISAITTPFVGCVVKHYIEYKKYQFDCLPTVCDRMEEVFRRSCTL